MKVIKRLLIVLVILLGFLVIGIGVINENMDETDLPTDVYNEDGNLLLLVTANLTQLFLQTATDEYTVIEELINLIILDSVRTNVNDEYDPLGDCDTDECNFIIKENNYNIGYIWAETNDDDQLIIHVSGGTSFLVGVNTIFDFTFNIETTYTLTGMSIALTLDSYNASNINLSMGILDFIFSKLDTEQIESEVSKGILDLDTYTYTLTYSILP